MQGEGGMDVIRLRSRVLAALIIAALAVLCYLNTLHAPFQWDESRYIADNPMVKATPYDGARSEEFQALYKRRPVGMLSFRLNYAIGGLRVEGYHALNIALHALNSAILYALLMVSLGRLWADGQRAGAMAFLSAALFALHPIQSEAVNYVYQRHVLFAALFSLSACLLYALSLMESRHRRALYAGCIIASALAMKSKESAFTLPALIFIYDLYLGGADWHGRMKRILPVALTALLVPLGIIDWSGGASISALSDATGGALQYGRLEYLYTQPAVVLDYIRLLILPTGQNIFHSVGIKTSIAHAALPAAVLLAAAIWAIRQRISPMVELRLMGFGMLWFLVALSVESSVIPIPMLMNEYRVYLPAAGFMSAMVAAAYLIGNRINGSRWRSIAPALLISLMLVLGIATIKRNTLWQSRVSLWQDAAAKSPNIREVRNNYGNALREAGRTADAVNEYVAAVELSSGYSEAWSNLGLAMLDAGRPEEAAGYFARSVSADPGNYRAYNNMGNALRAMSRDAEAMEAYRRAIAIRPDFGEALTNLGSMIAIEGMMDEAIALLEKSVLHSPELAEAHYNLAGAYMQTGRLDEAAGELASYLDLRPEDQETWRTLESLMGE